MDRFVSDERKRLIVELLSHIRTPLYGNAYALMLNTFFTSGLGVLYWVLAAHLYPVETVGVNAAAISTMMFLSGVAQLNLGLVLVRFLPKAGKTSPRFIWLTYSVAASLTATVSSIFVVSIGRWSPILASLRATPWPAVWFIFATVGWSIFALQDYALTGFRQALWIPLENSIFGVAKIVLLVLFAPSYKYGIFLSWTVPIAAMLLPINLLIFIYLSPRYIRVGGDQTMPTSRRQMVHYIAGDYLGSLCSLATVTLLPALVTHYRNVTANAYFYQSWIIAFALYSITISTTTSLTVEGARDSINLHQYMRRVVKQTFYLLTPAVIFVVLLAPYLLRIFGRDYAREGTVLLRLLALAAIPEVFGALAVSVARVQQNIGRVIFIRAAAAALVLGTSGLLLPRYGIQGIGIAFLLSHGLIATVLLVTSLKQLVKLPRFGRW